MITIIIILAYVSYYFIILTKNNINNNLAKSIYARYRQQLDNPDYPFPEDGYHGDYIKEIANELINENSAQLIEDNEENLTTIRKFGEIWCFGKINLFQIFRIILKYIHQYTLNFHCG